MLVDQVEGAHRIAGGIQESEARHSHLRGAVRVEGIPLPVVDVPSIVQDIRKNKEG